MAHHPPRIEEVFASGLSAHWIRTLAGSGRLHIADGALRLELPSASATRYSNAQIDDYSGKRASQYPWRPPLRLRVRARASHPAQPFGSDATKGEQKWLRGTAGFGFWNAPFTLAGGGLRLPDALWFFAASQPSRMALTADGQPHGWKAQVVHARRPGALMAAPPLALSALWARLSGDVHSAARWMERMTGAVEAPLDATTADLRQWREYEIEWLPQRARFLVDGRELLAVFDPPGGPLGFVAWIDNQYAVATPRGELRFGALDCEPQWLDLSALSIESLG